MKIIGSKYLDQLSYLIDVKYKEYYIREIIYYISNNLLRFCFVADPCMCFIS